ncbi:MAG: hypothetical protein NTY83_03760 [Candidatus Micrarchaeota archaeon]|nr:hypothetical protein [Candidatus Micrarchaeota archaeon]
MRTAVLHHPGKFMIASFSGEKGTMAADRIRAALEKAKEAMVGEKNVPIVGGISNQKEEMAFAFTAPQGNVLLGAGHIYLKTSTASLVRKVLNSIFYIGDNGLQAREGEPSFSTGYALGMGGTSKITIGSSSLRTALGIPIDRGFHAKMRDIVVALFGVEFQLKEIVLAFPCDSLLAFEGSPGRYAIGGKVPLGRLVLLNESGQLGEFCKAEADAEILRAGEGSSARKIYSELMDKMGEMAGSFEMLGRRWS